VSMVVFRSVGGDFEAVVTLWRASGRKGNNPVVRSLSGCKPI